MTLLGRRGSCGPGPVTPVRGWRGEPRRFCATDRDDRSPPWERDIRSPPWGQGCAESPLGSGMRGAPFRVRDAGSRRGSSDSSDAGSCLAEGGWEKETCSCAVCLLQGCPEMLRFSFALFPCPAEVPGQGGEGGQRGFHSLGNPPRAALCSGDAAGTGTPQ